MNFTFGHIILWPGPFTKNRRSSTFRADWNKTVRQLDYELAHLKAKQAVVQLAFTRGEDDIKNDGYFKANSKIAHEGVILSCDSPHGPLSWPCDTFNAWRDNVRAITLALEALRAVDRYGVTRRGEQYTGWKQLPGPLITPPRMSVEEAGRVVARLAGLPIESIAPRVVVSASAFRTIYRDAAKRCHPDVNQGRELQDWKSLQEAHAVLETHHGGQPK